MEKLKTEVDMYQIIDENGDGNEEFLSKLNVEEDKMLMLYEWMLKARMLDQKLLKMQRQGRIGTYGPLAGQEAAQVGSAFALKKEDWVFPSYREMAAMLVHGIPIQHFLKYIQGHIEGSQIPEDVNVFPIQIIIAGQVPQAAGCAWASKLRGEKTVTACYFGDGATSEGDFHEGLNFASVYKVPAVFFCQNNQWAISVPFEKQTATKTISEKASAYGMKGMRVDGNDVLAVYQVMKEAVDNARNGEGPTLIEAVTYRQGPHTTADDPTKYRQKGDADIWIHQKDPMKRYESFLLKRGVLTEEIKVSLTSVISNEIESEISKIEGMTPSPVYEAFDYVYDEAHPQLQKQKEELIDRLHGKGGSY
ncbi:pyruvate dehydrogenase (acetyl-transferring) E1 component subunit alpha [Bacillus sp. FJAT-47783]|uniref:pyruvate dehydrogenase (acetyl-transferring) E1 component subunit alpha n=1 Tax=Bacillus sp. FJAT-47783 TaxID=2922712 RepID=UPI001FABEDC1|nr:pyruvate dehydrogenase (acetyl-transferring) E1 component subunit alpha [Bacillus sp. FJAT-47783]